MWVKICGITTMRAGLAAVEAGASAVGLVFAPAAPAHRRLTPDRAQALAQGLPPGIARVGVFLDQALAEVQEVVQAVGLTHVQLHGAESPEYAAELSVPVIKAVRLRSDDDVAGLARYRSTWGILLEPHVPDKPGGTGVALDWRLARLARDEMRQQGYAGRVILAGGLIPETVRAAIRAVAPTGVDVSSGVETDGAKDLSKIYAFVANAGGSEP